MNPLVLASPRARSSSHECKPTCVGCWPCGIVEVHETASQGTGLRGDGSCTPSTGFVLDSDLAEKGKKIVSEARLRGNNDRPLQGPSDNNFQNLTTRCSVSGVEASGKAGIDASQFENPVPRIHCQSPLDSPQILRLFHLFHQLEIGLA